MKARKLTPVAAAISMAAGSISPAFANTFALEEVVVTATKRAENIQDVPISVSAFSGNFLENSGMEDLRDLGAIAPNLTITQSSQSVNQRISIRGVGTVGNNAMDPSVAVYVDGAYIARPGAVLGNLKDIEVAEVLRGPQGTLFGRNASMGALNIRTRTPEMDVDSLKVDAGMGDYGAFDTTLVGNKALTGNLVARVVASYAEHDGYGENRYDGSDTVGSRQSESLKAAFLFEPSHTVSALLRLDYQELAGTGSVIEVLPESANGSNLLTLDGLGNLLHGQSAAPDVSGLDHEIYQVHEDKLSDRQWGATLDITWDDAFAGHSVRAVTSYRDWQNDTSEFSVFRLPLDDLRRITAFYSDAFSQEVQLISPQGEKFDYVAGLYYFREDYDIDQGTDLGADFCPLVSLGLGPALGSVCAAGAQTNATFGEFSQQAQSMAGFFQGTYHISDTFSLTAGVRYSEDDKDGSFEVTSNNLVASAALAWLESHPDLRFVDEQVTWLANAKYYLADDIMLYATYSTGYKSGGFNSVAVPRDPATGAGLTAEQRLFDSEEVESYELGVKSTLLEGRMTANATLYRTDVENFQDRSLSDLTFITTNAGELRQQGLELDVRYTPVEALMVSLGYAYLDSEFLAYRSASPLPGQPGTQDLAGSPNRYSPEHQVNLASQWTQALGNTGMDWFVRGEVVWQDDSDVGATTNSNPQTLQDAYAVANLRIGLMSQDARWSVNAFVENVDDEAYCVGMYEQPNGGMFGTVDAVNGTTLIRCVQGDPRTIGIRGTYYFD
ncbi:TonB-dependent receptor [Parahaliea mediterranea]|uniref:TonB-dependent receptor n=1 Tax=Parahaliea mediterranea TaxID=651086 RepID=A0A939DGT6_9GAMM|nr:TonB-dependent receptor [Parahaliea mediterranea]MBN7797814.1 TonB-dependent receptor [Parahaliea mediterranea]